MAGLPMTERLLEHAKRDLELAEKQLAADHDNEWRRKAVLHAREKVESILRLLHDDKKDH